MVTAATLLGPVLAWLLLRRVAPCRHREWSHARDCCLGCHRTGSWLARHTHWVRPSWFRYMRARPLYPLPAIVYTDGSPSDV